GQFRRLARHRYHRFVTVARSSCVAERLHRSPPARAQSAHRRGANRVPVTGTSCHALAMPSRVDRDASSHNGGSPEPDRPGSPFGEKGGRGDSFFLAALTIRDRMAPGQIVGWPPEEAIL